MTGYALLKGLSSSPALIAGDARAFYDQLKTAAKLDLENWRSVPLRDPQQDRGGNDDCRVGSAFQRLTRTPFPHRVAQLRSASLLIN